MQYGFRMLGTRLQGKLHRGRVTHSDLNHQGSCGTEEAACSTYTDTEVANRQLIVVLVDERNRVK